MSALSDYLEEALLNHTLRNVAYTPAATVYAALYITNPADDDSGTEVAGGSYARQAITFTAAAPDGTGYSCSNNGNLTFPVTTGAWGLVAYIAVKDALAGGNLLFYGAATVSKNVGVDDQVVIATGNLVCKLE